MEKSPTDLITNMARFVPRKEHERDMTALNEKVSVLQEEQSDMKMVLKELQQLTSFAMNLHKDLTTAFTTHAKESSDREDACKTTLARRITDVDTSVQLDRARAEEAKKTKRAVFMAVATTASIIGVMSYIIFEVIKTVQGIG